MSDYLWDKQGEPDPEVEHLETLLRPLAYAGPPPRLPRRRPRLVWVSAGLLAVSALAALLIVRPWRTIPVAGWPVTVAGVESRLPVGVWLETGSSRARLQIADIGTAELEPATRVRIVATGPKQHKMQLERGTLSAQVHAPPRLFVIETPHALVIDLGCAFVLTVDGMGRARLVVTEGAVALADATGHEVIFKAEPARVDPPQPKPTGQLKASKASKPSKPSKPGRAAHQIATPTPAVAPAHKAEPPAKLNHDARQDLERSAQ